MKCDNQYLKKPVFISGFNKSGTTLFLALLDSHKQLVVIPEEFLYFRNVYLRRGKLQRILNKTAFQSFTGDKYLNSWQQGKALFKEGYVDFDKQQFSDRINNSVNTHHGNMDLMLSLVHDFAQISHDHLDQRVSWVTKSVQDELFFPVMDRLFRGQALFFYIVRNPKDVYLSQTKRLQAIYGEYDKERMLYEFVCDWKIQLSSVREFAADHQCCTILRYEDYTVDVQNAMGEVAAKIGIDYSESMLNPSRLGNSWGGNSVHDSHIQGVSTISVNRYRDLLDEASIHVIDGYLTDELEAFGYPVDNKAPLPDEQRKQIDRIYRARLYKYRTKSAYYRILSKFVKRV